MICHSHRLFAAENLSGPAGAGILQAAEQAMQFPRIRLHVLAGNSAQDFFNHP